MTDYTILLSWISNYAYCKRRFYLAVIEAQKAETNVFMAEGTSLHTAVDQPRIERRGLVVSVTRLHVHSKTHGLYGICDMVEFNEDEAGAYIPFLDGKYTITPVEYKHGKVRNEAEYELQLTAQAICMEEMYNTVISEGYIYYADSRHRHEVIFSKGLKCELRKNLEEMRSVLKKMNPIQPTYMRRCPKCAYYNICAPKRIMVENYMMKVWENI